MVEHNEEDRQRFILEASRVIDAFREWNESEEPDWDPLHAVLRYEHCHGFMWMYRVPWRDQILEVYKHGITRRSLHLDHEGRAYRYRGESDPEYEELPVEDAIEWVFAGIEQMGATARPRTTRTTCGRSIARRARWVGRSSPDPVDVHTIDWQ